MAVASLKHKLPVESVMHMVGAMYPHETLRQAGISTPLTCGLEEATCLVNFLTNLHYFFEVFQRRRGLRLNMNKKRDGWFALFCTADVSLEVSPFNPKLSS